MHRIFSIFLILSFGCSTKEKAPEPTIGQPVKAILTEDPQKLRRRAIMAQLELQTVGVIKRDDNPVEDTIAESTPENIQDHLKTLADKLEAQLELYRKEKREAKAVPSVQKTVKAGKRKFVFSSTLLDVKKVTCKGMGSDLLLCKLTFKVLRSNEGIRFQMEDADGAQLNMPTVGISERIANGVLTKQEIIIPKDTSTLTFLER